MSAGWICVSEPRDEVDGGEDGEVENSKLREIRPVTSRDDISGSRSVPLLLICSPLLWDSVGHVSSGCHVFSLLTSAPNDPGHDRCTSMDLTCDRWHMIWPVIGDASRE